MNKVAVHQNHVLGILDCEPKQLLEGIAGSNRLTSGEILSHLGPQSIEDEERHISEQSVSATEGFNRNRRRVIDTLRAIPSFVFEEYSLPRSNEIDIGCGATGFNVHELLGSLMKPSGIIEMDANPHAVEANKKLHPGSPVVVGSYLRLKELGLRESLDLVTGLSSLDATAFLDHAVEQIAEALKPGGYLFHMQDVRPGQNACLQALRNLGAEAPFPMKISNYNNPEETPVLFEIGGQRISSVELFRQRMAAALQKTPSLKPILNHWVVARRGLRHDEPGRAHPKSSITYWMNMHLEHLGQHDVPTQEAYAVVTLAQKLTEPERTS